MNKTTKIEIIIAVFLIAVFAISLIYTKYVEGKAEEEQIDTTVVALADVNRFFTIHSSISKYYSYIYSNDSDSLFKVLDQDYVQRNNITASNIYNFVGSYESNMKSSLEEAYQVSSYKNVYKYYVKVALKLETLYTSTLQGYAYYIVTIDENDLTFAIEPISDIIYLSKIGESDS